MMKLDSPKSLETVSNAELEHVVGGVHVGVNPGTDQYARPDLFGLSRRGKKSRRRR